MLTAFLRRRSSQCLVVGALVTVTVVYAICWSRGKPRRPSPSRRLGEKSRGNTTVATARKRWWQFSGGDGPGAAKNDKTDGGNRGCGADGKSGDGQGSIGDSNPELTQGAGDGSREKGNSADVQESPASCQSHFDDGGGSGEDMDGRAESDGQTHRDRKLVPSKYVDPPPTAFPSPEHHREEDSGREASWDGRGTEQRGAESAHGTTKGAEEQRGMPSGALGTTRGAEKPRVIMSGALGRTKGAEEPRVMPSGVDIKGGGKDEGGGGTGDDRLRNPLLVSEDPGAAFLRLPRESSSLSESSTEDLLAEADSLIAAGIRARKASHTTRATLARSSKHRAISGSASRVSSARATRTRSTRGASNGSSSGKNGGVASSSTRSSQARFTGTSGGSPRGRSSDPRMPKRARVYRKVSGEEVDALVSLTHRVLQLEPAALNEIAEDESLQRRQDGDFAPSVGELAANASVVWETGSKGAGVSAARGGNGTTAVVPTTSDLWGGREEATGTGSSR